MEKYKLLKEENQGGWLSNQVKWAVTILTDLVGDSNSLTQKIHPRRPNLLLITDVCCDSV